jgi:hypothetical protein
MYVQRVFMCFQSRKKIVLKTNIKTYHTLDKCVVVILVSLYMLLSHFLCKNTRRTQRLCCRCHTTMATQSNSLYTILESQFHIIGAPRFFNGQINKNVKGQPGTAWGGGGLNS